MDKRGAKMSASYKSLTISEKFDLVNSRYKSLKEEQEKATTMEEVQAVFEGVMSLRSDILQNSEILIENPNHDTSIIGIKKRSLSERSLPASTLTSNEAKFEQLKIDIKNLELELNDRLNALRQAERSAIQKRVSELDEELRQLEILLITEVTEDNLVSLPAQINKIQNELAMSKSTLIKDTNSESGKIIAAIAELQEKAKVLLILGAISKFKIELAKLQELKPNSSQEYEDAMSKVKEYSEKVGVEASNYNDKLSKTHPDLWEEYEAEFEKLQTDAQKLLSKLTDGKVSLEERLKRISQFQAELESIILPKDGDKVLEKEAEAQVDRKFNEFFKRIKTKIFELENAGSDVVLVTELKQLEEEGIQKLNDLRKHARKHLNAILDKLQAKLDLITAIENEIEIEKQFDVLTQEIDKAIAVNSNQMVLKGLIEFKSQAEESKNAVVKNLKRKKEVELNEKRTFAGYVFKPMSAGGEPKLLKKKVIYFSENDQCDFCIGLDSEKKRYERNIVLNSKLTLDVQLIDPDFQRRILNELAAEGFVSYSVQQDWEFVLSNLCDALNAVKDSIIDKEDSFYKELKKIGIFYDDEKNEYSVNLNKAKSSIVYRSHICNPDFLIAATFNDAVAKSYQAESRKLHAEQFKFNVSPEKAPIQNQNLSKAIDEVHEFQNNDRVKKQPVAIEEDREDAKKHLSGEARARLEEAQGHIAESKKQQQMLDEACKLQKKCVAALTPSEEVFQEEKETLMELERLKNELQSIITREKEIPQVTEKKIEELGVLFDCVNDNNSIDGIINLEISAREVIKKAIDTFVNTHERFTESPSVSIWISRSFRSARLARELASIKKALEKSNVKMAEVTGLLSSAIQRLQSGGAENSDLATLQKTVNALSDGVKNSRSTMDELLAQRDSAGIKQRDTIEPNISKLNQEIQSNDDELQRLNKEKPLLEQRIKDLELKIDLIQYQNESRAKVAERAKAQLIQLKDLRQKTRRGRLEQAADIDWFKAVSKEVTKVEEDSAIHREALAQRKDEMANRREDETGKNKLGRLGFFRAFQFSNVCVGLGEQPIEKLARVEPLQMKV
jgi:hypothetical protein